jgi:phage tail sheath gpL-like
MEIFGKHIFGSDANEFRSLAVTEQYEWIKKYTNQTNEDLINEFLSNIPENNDKNCLNCGDKRKTIPVEVTTNTEQINDGAISRTNNTKRPRATKRAKD